MQPTPTAVDLGRVPVGTTGFPPVGACVSLLLPPPSPSPKAQGSLEQTLTRSVTDRGTGRKEKENGNKLALSVRRSWKP